jgi:hypothetical protein
MDYGARFYSPALGRFISADSVVPQPGNPQSLNRFTYSFNNPLLYADPTGHFAVDDFLWGVVSQWTESNREAIPVPVSAYERQAVSSLAVDSDEYYIGRVVGAFAAAVQGVAETAGGGGGIVGGVALCGTGVGCLVGAPDIVLSAGVVVHGTAVALHGATDLGTQVALFANRQPTYTKNNYRQQFEKVKPAPANMKNPEDHHMLPQELESQFNDLGINIHEPKWQAWVESGNHQSWSYKYNDEWKAWFRENQNPTIKDIENQASLMAKRYEVDWP